MCEQLSPNKERGFFSGEATPVRQAYGGSLNSSINESYGREATVPGRSATSSTYTSPMPSRPSTAPQQQTQAQQQCVIRRTFASHTCDRSPLGEAPNTRPDRLKNPNQEGYQHVPNPHRIIRKPRTSVPGLSLCSCRGALTCETDVGAAEAYGEQHSPPQMHRMSQTATVLNFHADAPPTVMPPHHEEVHHEETVHRHYNLMRKPPPKSHSAPFTPAINKDKHAQDLLYKREQERLQFELLEMKKQLALQQQQHQQQHEESRTPPQAHCMFAAKLSFLSRFHTHSTEGCPTEPTVWAARALITTAAPLAHGDQDILGSLSRSESRLRLWAGYLVVNTRRSEEGCII